VAFLVVVLSSRRHALALTSIATCQQLQDMQDDLLEDYQLSQSIDCSDTVDWNAGAGFRPILKPGTQGFNSADYFHGTLNGNGFTISGLFINRPSTERVGLFSVLEDAIVENLVLENLTIQGYHSTGGIAGNIASSNLTNIRLASGSTVHGGTGTSVGGLVGAAFQGSAGRRSRSVDCTVELVAVAGGSNVGGVLGRVWAGTALVADAVYSGVLTSTGSTVGGIVGDADGLTIQGATVAAATDIIGRNKIGGVAGMALNCDFADVTVAGTIDASGVATPEYVGGAVGRMQGGSIVSADLSISLTTDVLQSRRFGGAVGYATEGATIRSVTVNAQFAVPWVTYLGGVLGEGTKVTIENASVFVPEIQGQGYVGGIAGYLSQGSIQGCDVGSPSPAQDMRVASTSGQVTGTGGAVGQLEFTPISDTVVGGNVRVDSGTSGYRTGGLVGDLNLGSTVRRCTSNATVSGFVDVGGLIGIARGLTSPVSVEHSHVHGTVISEATSSSSTYSSTIIKWGGFVGAIEGNTSISDSTASAQVSVPGGQYVGGFVGEVLTAGTRIRRCHASGAVSGVRAVGGFVGHGTVADVADSSASGAVDTVGIAGQSLLHGSIGGFAGSASQSRFENCHASGDHVESTTLNFPETSECGGFAGTISENSDVLQCSATVDRVACFKSSAGLPG